ncbi:XrtY-associated glycosyltransferase XYAG1 [Pedobacter frigoris]|uniref:Glycosyltransferase n=1 Tax=Pedobacter frigoris TaxID=2571272 RepID=A0A4U1CLF9_9SPHI|nr:glycosyltransferase [Pedobacter frigoris]TKC08641.1 glycosyltransferase [Pedobacter frigoris]
MKIIHISPSYKPAWCYGGPTRSISLLCEALTASGQQVEVLTTRANGNTELKIATSDPTSVDGVTIRYFKRITKDHSHFSPTLLYYLYKNTSSRNCNTIIHIHSWWNLTSMLSCLIAKVNHKSVVLSPRGMLSSYTFSAGNSRLKKMVHKIIGKKLIDYCHIHTTSNQEKKEILELQQVRNSCTIPNLIQLPEKQTDNLRKTIKTAPFKMLFLSRIDKKKGLELLFTALADLDFPWSLTIAGNGTDRYIKILKSLSDTLSISNSIIWLGEVSNADKYTLIAGHNLLALFSYNENFANVVLESLSMGTPVAISNQVGLADYIHLHQLGWISGLTIQSITATLSDAYKNDVQRAIINRSAPAMIRNHFSATGLVQQYINFYHKLA